MCFSNFAKIDDNVCAVPTDNGCSTRFGIIVRWMRMFAYQNLDLVLQVKRGPYLWIEMCGIWNKQKIIWFCLDCRYKNGLTSLVGMIDIVPKAVT